MLFSYNNIKIADQWGYLLYLRGLLVFLGFLMGFSVKSNGGWGPLYVVSVKRVGFQWGWSQVNGVALKVNRVDLRWGYYRGLNFQLEVGDFVAAIYEEDLKQYIGKIVEIDDADVDVTFMETSTSTINLRSMFKWPRNKDEVQVDKSHILC